MTEVAEEMTEVIEEMTEVIEEMKEVMTEVTGAVLLLIIARLLIKCPGSVFNARRMHTEDKQ